MLSVAFSFYPLLLSGVALAWLANAQVADRTVRLLCCGSLMSYVFLTAPWAFSSLYLRYIFAALFIGVAAKIYFSPNAFPAHKSPHRRVIALASLSIFILTLLLNAFAIVSRSPPRNSLSVAFPLASGSFYVLQGGSSAATNLFHWLSGNLYALDVVKLNRFGNRASGLAPGTLTAYEIFGEPLRSPCEGEVIQVRDSYPDNAPGKPDRSHSAGNHIVLECAGAHILLAHLKQHSIRVRPGESVAARQLLADVGNSGNSLEPHLHISASVESTEVGLRFGGRWLTANDVVVQE